MSFSLPNPAVPTNGNPLDATPVLANLIAIEQAIDSFDGSQIQAKSVTEQALADAVNPRLRGSENLNNYVDSGCTFSTVSGLAVTMTGGTIYVNGYREVVSSVGSETLTASEDIYVDIDYLGNITYNGVSNGASAPSLTANSIRVAKIVTGASSVSSITITGIDSNNVQIYPNSPLLPLNWISYTPTITNLTVGNGVLTARYAQIGKTVFAKGTFVMGSTSSISGALAIALPVTANAVGLAPSGSIIGGGVAIDAGIFAYPLDVVYQSTTTMVLNARITILGSNPVYNDINATRQVNATVPLTFGTSDSFTWTATYEAA